MASAAVRADPRLDRKVANRARQRARPTRRRRLLQHLVQRHRRMPANPPDRMRHLKLAAVLNRRKLAVAVIARLAASGWRALEARVAAAADSAADALGSIPTCRLRSAASVWKSAL